MINILERLGILIIDFLNQQSNLFTLFFKFFKRLESQTITISLNLKSD